MIYNKIFFLLGRVAGSLQYTKLARFNIDFFFFRYGTMHVVATNIILWIRTLIKESLEEISEIEAEHLEEKEAKALNETVNTVGI